VNGLFWCTETCHFESTYQPRSARGKAEAADDHENDDHVENDKALSGVNSIPLGSRARGHPRDYEICRHWERRGTCSFGNRCKFIHYDENREEIEKVKPKRTLIPKGVVMGTQQDV
jgi:hypothetical protein